MNFDKYKFEVMLIVIVVVLLIFWLMINYFDNKRNNGNANLGRNNGNANLGRNNGNANLGRNNGNASLERFENSTPSARNTAAPDKKSITNDTDHLNVIADKLKNSNPNNNDNDNDNANNNANNNKNELEKNMSVALKNSQLSKTNDSVASFYSLSMDQLNSLKQQTRKYGVLGLVFFDEKTDTLRIESTKG